LGVVAVEALPSWDGEAQGALGEEAQLHVVLQVTPEAVAHTIEIIRAHLPLPATAKVPKPAELLYLAPLRRALTTKPPA
jgi:hypothetical protein